MRAATDAPLAGRAIVVTRPRHQAASLSAPLRTLGATVFEEPAIRIEPPEDFSELDHALDSLDDYDWIVFTSANAVDSVLARRALYDADVRIAAIGPATAEALTGRGIAVDLVPERYVAEAVYESLSSLGPLAGLRFLLPRADIARMALPRLLEDAGAVADVLTAYRTVADDAAVARARKLVRDGLVDAVTFTSASTVRSFFAGAEPGLPRRVTSASIGPITSEALRALGVSPVIEALRYDNEGLVDAIRRYFAEEAEPS